MNKNNPNMGLGLLAALMGAGGDDLAKLDILRAESYALRAKHNDAPPEEIEKLRASIASLAALPLHKIQALVVGVVVKRDSWEPEMCGRCDEDHAQKSDVVIMGHGPHTFVTALGMLVENSTDPDVRAGGAMAGFREVEVSALDEFAATGTHPDEVTQQENAKTD